MPRPAESCISKIAPIDCVLRLTEVYERVAFPEAAEMAHLT